MMTKRVLALVAGMLVAMTGTSGAAWAQEPPPDENTILVEEIPHIAERSVMYSLPPDPDAAIEALSGYPGRLTRSSGCTSAATTRRPTSSRPASRRW